MWSYEKYGGGVAGLDAAWIDEVVLPQVSLTVTKAGGGSGTVVSTPFVPLDGSVYALAPDGSVLWARPLSGQVWQLAVTADGSIDEATPGMSVTIRLENEIDVPRGDMLVDPDDQPITARSLEATICWMSERPLSAGARFGVKHTTRTVRAVVEGIDGVVDMDTLEDRDATEMALNDIGTVRLRLSGPLMVDPYVENRATGAFILIDEATNDTVAAGMVRSATP